MRYRIRLALAGAAAAMVASTVVLAAAPDGPRSGQNIILGQGSDHLPSETASDWVTYADHVVVVTVAGEQEIPPTELEVARGEGVIGRELTLEIEQVLWSRDGAPQAPSTWNYSAVGYEFKDGDTSNRTKMALAERPRVESGHQYVMAMVWEEAECSDGDEPAPAQWRGLGEGSEVPFDNGVIGQGELAGVTRSASVARTAAADTTGSLEAELAGQGAQALVAALQSATPEESSAVSRSSAVAESCS
ncbi:hypothetical protein ACWD4J_10690 [Streptomyces sp. NPDC002577]